MLSLVLINVQYLQSIVFSSGKGLSGQNHIPTTQQKNLPGKFPIPLPLNTIWKTLGKGPSLLNFVCLFQVKFNFLIDNNFSE